MIVSDLQMIVHPLSDDHIRSSDDRIRSSDDRFRRSDDRMRSSDDRIRSSDDHFRPSDDRVRPSDDRVRPSVNDRMYHSHLQINQGQNAPADSSEEDDDKVTVKTAVHDFARLCAWPCVVQLIPQLTRSSCHRGEVYNLKHCELFCEDYGVCDEPMITKHAQAGTSSEDHNVLIHSGTGPFCNPFAQQVCEMHSVAVTLCYQMLTHPHHPPPCADLKTGSPFIRCIHCKWSKANRLAYNAQAMPCRLHAETMSALHWILRVLLIHNNGFHLQCSILVSVS